MKHISVGLALLVGACGDYGVPAESGMSEYSQALDKSYDDVWHSVIDYLSASSFAIDNSEKDAGLITFSFGQSDISSYVDCGQWTEPKSMWKDPESRFEGNYTDYLKQSAKGTLSGKMNISVREISENKTSVRTNAQYALTAFFYNPLNYLNPIRITWTFSSGSYDEDGYVGGTHRCQPTYFLEKSIFDAASSNSNTFPLTPA